MLWVITGTVHETLVPPAFVRAQYHIASCLLSEVNLLLHIMFCQQV